MNKKITLLKNLSTFIFFISNFYLLAAQQVSFKPFSYKRLEGKIGYREVVMHLNSQHVDYYYKDDGRRVEAMILKQEKKN